ncbi:hypothetical protein [Stenotrophomonas sp. 24(2023)]|uniref:hypothetical protein n=1 Tax=Stenotrophomonas sp. 24(2023) TaxID=3068324 RepID=UPI0027E065FC|nr:hypothetical protein [Stenotrophomonas sp. 24(2023)]WMJ69273.1 hypothetical protein Q9R17_19185 [Stenotrophomonas sp. 24(2023)]
MRPSLSALAAAAVLVASASACSRTPSAGPAAAAAPAAAANAAATAPSPAPAFSESPAGLRIDNVPGMHVVRDFTRSYLALDSWKLFAGPDSTGTPLAALVMDGSNAITAAELRVGRSTDAAAVAACLQPPAEATGAADRVTVAGVDATHFRSGDAAMSHYLSADSYRVVRDGACYAIDQIVFGTRPEVYDPPRTPPFSQDAAKAQLDTALKALHWVR